MKKWNLWGGMLFFIVFLATGGWLVSNVSASGDDYLHMAGRANHIYLLLIALLNIVFGVADFRHQPSRLLSSSRLVLLVSGVIAAIGFFTETDCSLNDRMLMPTAVGLAFLGVVLLLLNECKSKKQ